MRISAKYLLALELGLSFGAVVVLWLMGLSIFPGLLTETISGSENYSEFLLAMLLGAFGLVGIYQLAKIVLFDSVSKMPLSLIAVLVALGITGLFIGFGTNNLELSVKVMLVVLPVACSVHFLFLARQHLTRQGLGRT